MILTKGQEPLFMSSVEKNYGCGRLTAAFRKKLGTLKKNVKKSFKNETLDYAPKAVKNLIKIFIPT